MAGLSSEAAVATVAFADETWWLLPGGIGHIKIPEVGPQAFEFRIDDAGLALAQELPGGGIDPEGKRFQITRGQWAIAYAGAILFRVGQPDQWEDGVLTFISGREQASTH